uniref:Uncharacterized protein n=1 Tax=Spumella elongata TaxID=89044 RepID=A0A7S3GVC7_9STRA|mmetsp:Transcript_20040/g.34746  ORF Transcript_20040/g.34746 Transcript_20040/m.34746 type:complete len:546 (+) Transcript_20040:47-1684(+)
MKAISSIKAKSVLQLIDSHVAAKLLRPRLAQILENYKSKIETYSFKESSPHEHMIYANNYLNYGELKVIGFDLDYTLVSYTPELQTLIYNLARNQLVNVYGYPQDLGNLQFDPNFAIRGLSVDARFGTLGKLSHLQRLASNRTYIGKKEITPEEMLSLYGDRHISYGDLNMMRPLNDLFSVAEGCLIADTMELFLSRAKRTGESFVATSIVDDVQKAISDVHINGSMQGEVLSDPQRYIKNSPDLGNMLTHVKESGKQSFLCTNSTFAYSNRAMNHALGLKAESTEWRDLFDVVICSAKKPDFYKSRQPFREYDTVRRSPTTSPVVKLERGKVYVQGSADALQRATGWKTNQVLYLGDNLRADLVEARRWHGWHTGCIIDELGTEIATSQSPPCKELHFLRSTLRNLMYDLQLEMQRPKQMSAELDSSHVNRIDTGCSQEVKMVRLGAHFETHDEAVLCAIESEMHAINAQLSKLYNPHFGSVFRTDGHPSLFAFAVLRYVDLYMSDVTNLLHYNPQHRFYPYHSMHMAHDPASLSTSVPNTRVP